MGPSLLRCGRRSALVKGRLSAALSGNGQEARNWRDTKLGMGLTIIFVLDPRLRRLVEKVQGEIRYILQHGEETPLYQTPQDLDFGVLIWAIWKRCLIQNAEPGKAFGDLRRRHGGAVVALGGAR